MAHAICVGMDVRFTPTLYTESLYVGAAGKDEWLKSQEWRQ